MSSSTVRMRDIAERAEVSRATVSYVLNDRQRGDGTVSEETRRRVTEVARELGYRRNEMARAFVTGKSRVLGLLATYPDDENVARMLAGALDEAEEQGYFIKVLRARDYSVNPEIINRCAELRLAGVISLHMYGETLDYLHEEMARYQIPVAIMDSSFPQQWGIRVFSDDAQGVDVALRHLIDLGHKRIAFLSGYRPTGATALREAAFRSTMAQNGLEAPDEFVRQGFWEVEWSMQSTRAFLTEPTGRATAILCEGDEMALSALNVANELGLKVPHDLSIIGYSNRKLTQWTNPALSSVAQPFHDMGRVAVRQLIERVTTTKDAFVDDPLEVLLPTELVLRNSTAPPSTLLSP